MTHDARADIQRIVLRGSPWQAACHVALGFPDGCGGPLHFLHALRKAKYWPTPAAEKGPSLQFSLGFTRRGLERARVPSHVLACFAAKAPAFHQGAALRAAAALGLTGRNGPRDWDPRFGFETLDAVLSVHAMDEAKLDAPLKEIATLASGSGVQCGEPLTARRLDQPDGVSAPNPASAPHWIHFGYRDGLSRIGIEGFDEENLIGVLLPDSRHAAGEFVLGHPRSGGAVSWIAGPAGRPVWPRELRAFFRNGSFGVLHRIEQNIAGFEAYVAGVAKTNGVGIDVVKGWLCGRMPDGRPLAVPELQNVGEDFDYSTDPDGLKCPFGSHVRRMNPRGGKAAHTARRPLLRRGMPYGPVWRAESQADHVERGLMGQFFCASIEDQFEHLLAEWADRVPLGSEDPGGARDPLLGAHESGDGPFAVAGANGGRVTLLFGMRPFVRTRGLAYLFYPGLDALWGIAENRLFAPLQEDAP